MAHIGFHEGFGDGRIKGWFISRPNGRFERGLADDDWRDGEFHEKEEYLHSDGVWRDQTCIGDVWSGYFVSEEAAREAAHKTGIADSEIQTDKLSREEA